MTVQQALSHNRPLNLDGLNRMGVQAVRRLIRMLEQAENERWSGTFAISCNVNQGVIDKSHTETRLLND